MSDKVVRKTTMTFIKCPACSSFFRMDGPSITYPFDVPETVEIPFLGGKDGEVVLPPGFVYQKHGYWIPQDNTRTKFMCSDCKSRNHDGSGKYCSQCGCKMDAEVIQ